MHEQFLLAALDQARLGRGFCAPNPSVGAVAVHDGKIIAQTWHRGAGTPHAEQLLIEKLPKNNPDITLYVTLEPCNHWGKTPPCVDVIVNHGIKKVVYAYRDPNPVVKANNTPRLLNAHGVEFLHYPLAAIDDFYQSYHYWTLTKKPWVTVKMAHTLDGKIAGPQGARVLLSNPQCATFTHEKRRESDVILTTARTVNLDDPLFNARTDQGNFAKPLAIIDSKGALNPAAKVFITAKHCHIYHGEPSISTTIYPNSQCHAMPLIHGLLDLEAVISHLGDLGYHDVWVEAGGTLFSALHLARLVNRTYLYLVPNILGESATPAFYANVFHQQHRLTWLAMGDNMIARLDWVEEALCSQA